MSFEVIFQLATSATASFCCGTSLLVWLLSIKAFSLPRLSRDFLISSQLIIGSAAFLGLIGSIPLVLFELKWTKGKNPISLFSIPIVPNSIPGLSWPILQQEIGSVFLLLILNEVSALNLKESDTDLSST